MSSCYRVLRGPPKDCRPNDAPLTDVRLAEEPKRAPSLDPREREIEAHPPRHDRMLAQGTDTPRRNGTRGAVAEAWTTARSLALMSALEDPRPSAASAATVSPGIPARIRQNGAETT